MAVYQWITGAVPSNIPIKQIYGIAFDEFGRILLRLEDDNKYKLTGGKPEIQDQSMEDTLKREFSEETNITLKEIFMLGYQYVDEENGIPPYAQVRMIALIDCVGKQLPDKDNGKVYKRLLTSPLRAITLLNWGRVGEEQIKEAVMVARNKFKLNNNVDEEEFIDS